MVKAETTPEKISIYPIWKTWLWRFVRGCVASALAQSGQQVLIDVQKIPLADLIANPLKVAPDLGMTFVTGFLLALGLIIRDKWGQRKGGLVSKIII